MRAVRSRGTKPEIVVRQLAHRLGYRFRLHRRDLPGTPDLVFPGRRKVIFVHGCFWHQHKGCRRATVPRSNVRFWRAKLAGNMKRDAEYRERLKAKGWRSLIIWECETKNEQRISAKLRRFLGT